MNHCNTCATQRLNAKTHNQKGTSQNNADRFFFIYIFFLYKFIMNLYLKVKLQIVKFVCWANKTFNSKSSSCWAGILRKCIVVSPSHALVYFSLMALHFFVTKKGVAVLPYMPYSLDLALADFFPFFKS